LSYPERHQNPSDALAKAADRGVSHCLSVATSLDGFEAMNAQLGAHENVSFSCGVHPLHVHEQPLDKARLQALALNDKVVAIGETGLDYFYNKETVAMQQRSLIEHIEVAREVGKPLIIHTRDAREDTLALLKTHGAAGVGGVLHCFTESYEMAEQAMEMGFYISASGIISFNSAKSLKEIFAKLPLERLLVETDSPYLAPVPYRGEENQPAYTRQVAQVLAEIRGESLETIAQATTDNFFRLFKGAQR
jgi:TatD DNase family protein